MICLVLVNSHLFPLSCNADSAVSREGFNVSVFILASLLVCPMFGCRHSLMRLSNNSTLFSSGVHIFKHSYLCTTASRWTLPSVFGVKIFKSLQNFWHRVTDITSFGKHLGSCLGHTLKHFCPNLVQYRFRIMYHKESLTLSSMMILSTN